jgi:hypothetical protein
MVAGHILNDGIDAGMNIVFWKLIILVYVFKLEISSIAINGEITFFNDSVFFYFGKVCFVDVFKVSHIFLLKWLTL